MYHKLILKIQKAMFPEFVNGYEPRKNKGSITGGQLYSDLKYGDCYPNSYVDLYKSDKQKLGKAPLVIYCHGGGYTWGDKVEGDPNASDKSFCLFQEFIDHGYDVASVNYALAPEFQYPVPLIQLDECMQFLIAHKEKYRLDVNRIILIGSSAGAHLAGQYADAVTNIAYASRIGMYPVLKQEQLMAFVSQSGLLDNERFDRTDSRMFNFILRRCGRAYFDVKKLKGNPKVIETNVIDNMTEKFPPVFISDGNIGTFTDQATDIAEQAKKLGLEYELKLYPQKTAKLGHGFEAGQAKQAVEVRNLMFQFLEKIKTDTMICS